MSNHPVEIRNAGPDDIKSMVLLLEQLFSIEKDFIFNSRKHVKGLHLMLDGCGKHRIIKVAVRNGRIVGMCSVQTRISTAYGQITAVMEDLVVDRNQRGLGVGKALLKAIESWSEKRGIDRLGLLADRDNTPALSFYRSQGWHETNLVCLTRSR